MLANLDRDVLLVGLGADVRADGDAVGLRAPRVVPARDPGARAGDGLVLFFTGVNLCGVTLGDALGGPDRRGSAALAFLSALDPGAHGQRRLAAGVDVPSRCRRSAGVFGGVTSAMAGLYLIGFAAPAFEAAACHVGETTTPTRNVPRAMFASAGMATVYFVVLPVVWLGVLGPRRRSSGDLPDALGPTFAPLLGGAARSRLRSGSWC